MLLFREKIPDGWLERMAAHLPAVLVDHAHLERKAATTAINLEKYRDLFGRVEELNAIAIEELPKPGGLSGTQVLNILSPSVSYRAWQMPNLYAPPTT